MLPTTRFERKHLNLNKTALEQDVQLQAARLENVVSMFKSVTQLHLVGLQLCDYCEVFVRKLPKKLLEMERTEYSNAR